MVESWRKECWGSEKKLVPSSCIVAICCRILSEICPGLSFVLCIGGDGVLAVVAVLEIRRRRRREALVAAGKTPPEDNVHGDGGLR